MKNLTNLTELDISDDDFSLVKDGLSALQNLTKLKKLTMSGITTHNGAQDFQVIKNLTALEELDMRYNCLIDPSIFKDINLPHLQKLDLGHQYVSVDSEQVETILPLKSLDGITLGQPQRYDDKSKRNIQVKGHYEGNKFILSERLPYCAYNRTIDLTFRDKPNINGLDGNYSARIWLDLNVPTVEDLGAGTMKYEADSSLAYTQTKVESRPQPKAVKKTYANGTVRIEGNGLTKVGNVKTETTPVKFKTITKNDPTLPKGTTRVQTHGKDGSDTKIITYKVDADKGLTDTIESVRGTHSNAVDQVELVGTKETSVDNSPLPTLNPLHKPGNSPDGNDGGTNNNPNNNDTTNPSHNNSSTTNDNDTNGDSGNGTGTGGDIHKNTNGAGGENGTGDGGSSSSGASGRNSAYQGARAPYTAHNAHNSLANGANAQSNTDANAQAGSNNTSTLNNSSTQNGNSAATNGNAQSSTRSTQAANDAHASDAQAMHNRNMIAAFVAGLVVVVIVAGGLYAWRRYGSKKKK